MIKVNRKTTESNHGGFGTKGLSQIIGKINTPIPFLNHMIEHIAWRCGMGIEVMLLDTQLNHLVCEDVGMTLGRAALEAVERTSCKGYGNAVGIIDGKSVAAIVLNQGQCLLWIVRLKYRLQPKIPTARI